MQQEIAQLSAFVQTFVAHHLMAAIHCADINSNLQPPHRSQQQGMWLSFVLYSDIPVLGAADSNLLDAHFLSCTNLSRWCMIFLSFFFFLCD